VRPEDVRHMIERWGAKAALQQAVQQTPAPATQAGGPSATPVAPSGATEEDPVDMERLLEFTDGSADNLRELVTLYLTQTTEQLEKLRAAVDAGDSAEVRRVAHSCAGASATCGMRHLVPLLRELEQQGRDGKLTSAQDLFKQAGKEFKRICSFFEERQAGQADIATKN